MRVLTARWGLHWESRVLLASAQRDPGADPTLLRLLEPPNQPRGFPHTAGEEQGDKHTSWDGACAPAWNMQGHPKGLCFPPEPLAPPPTKGSPVGFRFLALTRRKNISQDGEISKGVRCLFREGMPGYYLSPKGTFACSEMLENSTVMALLGPAWSRGGSRRGVPTGTEQDGSFLQPEPMAIRNNPPEKPECKAVRRRRLPEPHVPAGELPRHHGSESPLRSRELPPRMLSLRRAWFPRGSQPSPKEADAPRLLH